MAKLIEKSTILQFWNNYDNCVNPHQLHDTDPRQGNYQNQDLSCTQDSNSQQRQQTSGPKQIPVNLSCNNDVVNDAVDGKGSRNDDIDYNGTVSAVP